MNPEHIDRDAERAALAICDQATIVLAGMLPGCAARRYDLPNPPDCPWWVNLCFADHGPIVPNLSLSFHPPYFTWAGVSLHYGSMLTDPYDFGVPFPGHSIKGVIPLDGGPETVAAAIYGAIAKVDLAKMVAAGTIERIFAEYPRHPVPWTSFYLAQCAVYLQKYEDARDLLENALKYADQKGRQYYGTLASEAEVCLSKLDSNPRFLRQELVEMMDYNWSHFKVVS